MSRHRAALLTIAFAVTADAVFGTAFALASSHVSVGDGLFMAAAIGSTSGYASVPVHGWLPHVLVALMFVTIIPLFAGAFSLVTSGLTATHVEAAEHRIKEHVETRLRHHLGREGDRTP